MVWPEGAKARAELMLEANYYGCECARACVCTHSMVIESLQS
jgi:hypothetical protein